MFDSLFTALSACDTAVKRAKEQGLTDLESLPDVGLAAVAATALLRHLLDKDTEGKPTDNAWIEEHVGSHRAICEQFFQAQLALMNPGPDTLASSPFGTACRQLYR